jgi:hypothetical protein
LIEEFMKRNLDAIVTLAMLLALFGCSSGNQEKPNPATPGGQTTAATQSADSEHHGEALTGRVAFQKMYVAARNWSPDAQGFRLESQTTSDSNGAEGKSAVWRARFGSRARTAAKPILWSGSSDPDAPSRGLDAGGEDSFNASNSSTRPFDIAFLKADSDKAFQVAQEHGGKKVLQKNPKTPVYYLLQWDPQKNTLVWHVSYGDRGDPRIAVNASTGEFIRVEK